MKKIMIVDDHACVGEGTKAILDEEFDFQIDVISSSKEAHLTLKEDRYDIYF
jgi:two-component system, NarL family, competent response regulator ComA